jgi:hypothetical protein
MKRLILPALAGLLLMMSACSKDPVNNSTTLVASKTNDIKKGEPILFTLYNNPDSIVWTITPSVNTQVTASGSVASIKFGRKGTFKILATSGTKKDSTVVNVEDSVFTPPTSATLLPFSAGEKISITASKLDSGASSGLILYAHTKNSYSCFTNYLSADYGQTGDSCKISFTGVAVPANCTSGTAPADGFEYFIPLNDGTHTLTIKLNNNTYTGSVVKAGSNYSINWSYTDGVVILPSTL